MPTTPCMTLVHAHAESSSLAQMMQKSTHERPAVNQSSYSKSVCGDGGMPGGEPSCKRGEKRAQTPPFFVLKKAGECTPHVRLTHSHTASHMMMQIPHIDSVVMNKRKPLFTVPHKLRLSHAQSRHTHAHCVPHAVHSQKKTQKHTRTHHHHHHRCQSCTHKDGTRPGVCVTVCVCVCVCVCAINHMREWVTAARPQHAFS